jgi:hypothetical protein
LLGVAGVRAVAAQDDEDEEEKICSLTLVATVAVGPDKDEVYEGKLRMVIGPEGTIDDGTLETEEGDEYELVGQATGRALNLRITIADERYLSLTGTGQQDIVLCRGSIDGTFGGPRTGDLGTWYAARQKRKEEPTVTPTNESGGGNGGDNSNHVSPTPTPCDPDGVDCGVTFVVDPHSCECVCPQPYHRCGDVCCYGGSVCHDNGSCSCPEGMEPCKDVCTQSCSSGYYLDPNSCQCTTEASCDQGQTLCNDQCVSTDCPSHQLFDHGSCQCMNRCSAGQDYCNESCIDVVNDVTNCGSCGNACAQGMSCIAGTCDCPVGYDYCASQQQCLAEGTAC